MSAGRRRVLVVGGLSRLETEYGRGLPEGVEVVAVMGDSPSLEERALSADALVLVIGNVSHPAAAKVRSAARRRGTPLASVPTASAPRVRATVTSMAAAAR